MCGSSGPSAGEMRRMQEEERRRMEYEATMKKARALTGTRADF